MLLMARSRLSSPTRLAALALCGLVQAAAWAQGSGSTTAAAATDSAGRAPDRGHQSIERIRFEDGGSRIDELRVGGQTQSIVVQPKGDLPAYEVRPPDARGTSAQSGARVWNFLRF